MPHSRSIGHRPRALLQAALLLDAQDPESVQARLPGLRPADRQPGYFDWPNPAGTDTRERLAILHRLKLSRNALR